MKYSDIVKINRNFQSSINLELDLNNEKKIVEYIPTADTCDVLKRYLRAFTGASNEKATTLVGPYGKGKSFLLLVLAYITGKPEQTKTYVDLLAKIKLVDKDLYELIRKFDSKKMRLLPIIINSNYDNLNQAFMLALSEALSRANLNDIIPHTTYDVCIELLDKWEKDSLDKQKTYRTCISVNNIKPKQLRKNLTEYSVKAYEQFEKLYNCMTIGLKFNPLISNDTAKIYSDVNYELCKRHYSGMLVIFDEFSKFIESAGSTLSRDLKVIQDLAEISARSSINEQFNLCCVTHKSLELYSSGSNRSDSFRTVEGRFTEIKFNRSLEENYQMISAAIRKQPGYERTVTKYLKDHSVFYEEVLRSQPFEKTSDMSILLKECFPLNPFTVYALIHLSEIVAQNERTLFTFISDTDDNSFNSFVHKATVGEKLFNVDKIYDYFSPLMRREETNSIRNIWFRSEGTLTRIENPEKRAILKSLAVILMIGDYDRLAPTIENISLSTDITIGVVSEKVKEMIDDHFVRISSMNNLLSFASSNSKEIEKQVELFKKTKARSVQLDSIAEEIDETKYILPRKHNEINKITRFYRVAYVTEDQLETLTSFKPIHDRAFCDGLIINVIRKKMKVSEIKKKVNEIHDELAIVKYPKNPINSYFYEEIVRYAALQEILSHVGNDGIVTREIEMLSEECVEDIRKLLKTNFSDTFEYYSYGMDSKESYTALLSTVMDNAYEKGLIFNNELVNKNEVTTQYQKSVNGVINWILSGMDDSAFLYSETSPESTVCYSVVRVIDPESDGVSENARRIVEEIKESIVKSENKRCLISDIVDQYTSAPIGIRRGILPILIAKAIGELSDNVLLYLQDKEIDLNADNISKAVYSNGKYYFGFSRGSKSQSDYLYMMLKVMDAKAKYNFRADTKLLCEEYRKFFVGLPAILRTKCDLARFLHIDSDILEYRDLFMTFNMNPYELVFEKPVKVFKTNDYAQIFKKVSCFISSWKGYLEEYRGSIIKSIKDEFAISSSTSLKMGMTEYVKDAIGENKPLLSETSSRVYQAISNMTFDDSAACNDLAIACVGCYVEDWNKDETQSLITALQRFKRDLENLNSIDITTISLDQLISENSGKSNSPLGKLMRNSIESVFKEYGESVSSEEKIVILSEILKNIL